VELRRAGQSDADGIADVFIAALAGMSYLPRPYSDEETRGWMRGAVLAEDEVWVAGTALFDLVTPVCPRASGCGSSSATRGRGGSTSDWAVRSSSSPTAVEASIENRMRSSSGDHRV
jgi:hypothetical protein